MGLLIGLSAAAACAGRRSTDRSWTRKPMRCSILQQRKRTVDHAAVRQRATRIIPDRPAQKQKSVCLSINYDGTAAGSTWDDRVIVDIQSHLFYYGDTPVNRNIIPEKIMEGYSEDSNPVLILVTLKSPEQK